MTFLPFRNAPRHSTIVRLAVPRREALSPSVPAIPLYRDLRRRHFELVSAQISHPTLHNPILASTQTLTPQTPNTKPSLLHHQPSPQKPQPIQQKKPVEMTILRLNQKPIASI